MKQLTKALPILIFLFFAYPSYAQKKINYLKKRKKVILTSCITTDAASIEASLNNISKLKPALIKKGLDKYYYDYGTLYMTKFFKFKEAESAHQSIAYYNKCTTENQAYGSAYSNVAVMYATLEDYGKALEYIALHKKYTPKKDWVISVIEHIEKRAGE